LGEAHASSHSLHRGVEAIPNRGKILLDLRIGCRHRRTGFPVSPVTKPGEPHGEMYVVCLDCGKHFHYDWEQMRMGALIENPTDSHIPVSRPAARKRSIVRYLAAAITLPALWIIGKAALKSPKEQKPENNHGKSRD